jgi:hypothetical protein
MQNGMAGALGYSRANVRFVQRGLTVIQRNLEASPQFGLSWLTVIQRNLEASPHFGLSWTL